MKVISFISKKGGCGKTTLSLNLAAALAEEKKNVLFIDIDPQAYATFALGYTNDSKKKNIYDVFRAYFEAKELYFQETIIKTRKNLSFIASNILLNELEINLWDKKGTATILFNILSDDFFNKYDYVIIDSPPNFGFLTLNAMYCSDILLVPICPNYFCFYSIDSIYMLKDTFNIKSKRKAEIFFIMNMYNSKAVFDKGILKELERKIKTNFLSAKIQFNSLLKEVVINKKTVFDAYPKSLLAEDFKKFANEVMNITMSKAIS